LWSKRLLFVAKSAVVLAASALASVSGAANAQTVTITALYRLDKDSSFEQGCFPPCECPVMLGAPVTGTFLLTPSGYDGLYNTYAVTRVNLRVPFNSADMIVTGSGSYKVGGEVALLRELALELQLGGAQVGHFDSGLVPVAAPLPDLKVTISTNHQYCFDSAFNINASPAPAPQLRLGLASTNEIVFSWPVSAAPFALEESSDLKATNWTTVTNAPTDIGEENQVMLTRPPGNRFYRLLPHGGAGGSE
jgi:opacity protein-like surface antigen